MASRTPANPRPAGLFWPVILTISGILILCALGIWQLQRMQWKQGLLAGLTQRFAQAPVALSSLGLGALKLSSNVAACRIHAQAQTSVLAQQFRTVVVRGTFQHDKEMHLYATHKTLGLGYRIVTPLIARGGSVVLVVRGFIPKAAKEKSARNWHERAGEVSLTGHLRLSEQLNMFTPEPDINANIWFARDLCAMARYVAARDIVPMFLVARLDSNPKSYPRPDTLKSVTSAISNRHLEYALTWFALALCLAGVFTVYFVKHRRGI